MYAAETEFDLTGFVPLSSLLGAISTEEWDRSRTRLAGIDARKLVLAYNKALKSEQRELAYAFSEELTRRGIPPCFREAPPHSTLDINLRFDLLAHDLQWVAAHYPDQRHKASSGYAGLLFGVNPLKRAEYRFTTRKTGHTWILVKQLRLTLDQQWECNRLRSRPVKLAARSLTPRAEHTLGAIVRYLPTTMRTMTRQEAGAALLRRYRVWLCAEMTQHSPTRAARLYRLWTSHDIGRNIAARDIEWVRRHIPESKGNTTGSARDSP
jgi:hypothetical protein